MPISFRKIERILISFQNEFPVINIENVIKELEVYLKVDSISKTERKAKTVGKLIMWLALKIGIHMCCSNLK